MKPSYVAVIPARAGSKRVKKKNIRPFLDTSLVEIAIEFAMESKLFDRIIVSSDDEEVLSLEQDTKYTNVSFVERDEKSAGDTSSAAQVVFHLLGKDILSENGTAIVYLQPTSPFRKLYDLMSAVDVFENNGCLQSVVSVAELSEPQEFLYQLDKDNSIDISKSNVRSQDGTKLYKLSGEIYITPLSHFSCLNTDSILTSKAIAFKSTADCTIDIDTELDFNMAEYIFKINQEKNND
ncbi:acylneuraminate cytidylyltransferase family protein [Litoribacillus peritrichatus]|uniref:N-acylneuraminate cytidylyltransferase n=1 Tax=Litoribacillus peritrichatus TaxID=718191 RepID=A0ABP7M2L3_9GAMM